MTEWKVEPPAPATFIEALRDLHPLTAQTLYARGWHDPDRAREFLAGAPPPVNPFSLKDMPLAVERILEGIRHGELITVYGDYDCDGVTAGALLMRTLASLGAKAQIYIPDRIEEGYGLNAGALDKLKAQGVRVVITVDCGVRAFKEALHAKGLGIDLIVTDHHELESGAVPQAFAVVDPKRPDCPYEFDRLAGVGVAFRLAQCLLRSARDAGMPKGNVTEASLLDYVAIGTVADVVPLTGENRALVRAGLERINTKPRIGLKALMQAAGVQVGSVNAAKIGYAIGPRLNAAGRLESALVAYQLLRCEDNSLAVKLAAKLNQQNSERQTVTSSVVRNAEKQVKGEGEAQLPALLFAASSDFKAGVIGLAAARLMEKYYRPAVVVSVGDDEARGSCRSVNGFNINEALDECDDLLLKHGGHAAAAGFTMKADRVDELQRRLASVVECKQPANGWQRVIRADGELDLSTLNEQAFAELQQLEPHGAGNPKPTFVVRKVILKSAMRMGKSNGEQGPPHLRLVARDSDRSGIEREIVGWRMGERVNEVPVGARMDVAFQLEMNEWNGERRMQWVAQDFKSA